MTDIAQWLAGLGLGQYAESFEENDIDASVLADLTDQDLKEIGVASVGHRRRLMVAIAAHNQVGVAGRFVDCCLFGLAELRRRG